MWSNNKLTKLLQSTYPIIQAPMGGGATTPQLVAAVSNSGGFGFLAGGYLSAAQIRSAVQEIRSLTDRPFGINLFVPEFVPDPSQKIEQINQIMQPYRTELGLEGPPDLTEYAQPFEEQMAVVLETKVPVFSFTFGLLSDYWLQKLKVAGVMVMGTATTVREAMELEQIGVDAVVAQGSEAGAHRGTFRGTAENAMIGTIALIPQIADNIKIPVVAAGGIMDGRGIVAALALGAAGVQMGTAFLTCPESGIHLKYKEALLHSTEESTSLTRAFSGKAARGIKNRFMTEMQQYEAVLPAYPVQNALTRDIRQAAGKHNQPEFMSLWAGQGSRLCSDKPAGELVTDLVRQVASIIEKLD